MSEQVLDSYLVALGFKVDEASAGRAERAIAKFALSVATIGTAVAAAAVATVAGVAKISSQMENLYYASQRIGSTVENIQALTFAIGQAGGTVGGARNALEGLGNFLRSNPGAEGFIRRLGVDTRDAHGGLRDTSDMLRDVGQRLKAMPYARARLVAQVMGVDENTLQALFRGTDAASAAIHRMYRSAGLNADQAAKGAAGFMNQLRLFGAAIGILEQGVAAKMQGGLGRDVDRLRERLVLNFGRISDVVAWVAHGVLTVADAMLTLGLDGVTIAQRIYDWWGKLDKSTRRWIVGIGLAELALRALNTGFLATPLGRILAIGVALSGLIDDFTTWKAGGKSLIDWSQWSTEIDSAIKAFDRLETAWSKLWPSLKSMAAPFLDWFGHQFSGAIKDTLLDLGDVADAMRMAMSGDYKGAKEKLAGIGKREAESLKPVAYALTPTSGTRGERNHNPLNLKFNASQDGVMGADGGGFGIYQTMADGVAAAERQLMLYRSRGIDTVSGIVSKWAPAGDGNDTAGYIAQVAKALGVDANARIDVNDPAVASKLIGVMGRRESGFDLSGSDLSSGIQRARAAAGSLGQGPMIPRTMPSVGSTPPTAGKGSAAGITQNTTITVHGSSDPKTTADHVGRALDGANNRLMRQMTGPRYG